MLNVKLIYAPRTLFNCAHRRQQVSTNNNPSCLSELAAINKICIPSRRLQQSGIPKVPSSKKSPPARPGPPVRPPLPKSPKHTPKAGVISVIPQSLPHDGNQRSLPAPPSGNEYATSAHSTPSPHSSPTNEPNAIPPSLPPTQEASIKETNASNAIYEEINDDVVS